MTSICEKKKVKCFVEIEAATAGIFVLQKKYS